MKKPKTPKMPPKAKAPKLKAPGKMKMKKGGKDNC